LRFGFEATYGRDTMVMRDDNVADYPWLCFALAPVMREYADGDSTRRPASLAAEAALAKAAAGPEDLLVEALVNGLSSDPRAFSGGAPASLAAGDAERGVLGSLFAAHRDDLVEKFERFR